MQRTFRSRSLAALVVAMFVFVAMADSALAISISPPTVDAPTVLRGVPQTKSIRVGRLPSEIGDITIDVSTRGEFASYIVHEPSFVIPKGEDAVEFAFQIHPENAQTGTYTVPMTFSLKPVSVATEQGSATVGVVTGATAMVTFTITGDEVIGYEFLSIGISDLETDDKPYVTITVANTGNVDWKPDSIDLTFTNTSDATVVFTKTIDGSALQLISPGQTGELKFAIEQLLPEGAYTLKASFVDGDQTVGELTTQQFAVFAPGTLLQSGELVSVVTASDAYELGQKVLLEGVFKNTGDIPVTGIFMTEVYLDGEYLDVIRGEELSVGVGEEVEMKQVYDIVKGGDYTFTSYVKYANRKTSSVDVGFTVGSGAGVLSFFNSPAGLGVIVGCILLIVGLVVMKRRARQGDIARPQQAAVAPVPSVPSAAKPESGVTEEQTRRW